MTGQPFDPGDPNGSRILRPGQPAQPQGVMLTCGACGLIAAVPAEAMPLLAQRHNAGCVGPRLDAIARRLGIMPAPADDTADQAAADAAPTLTNAPGDDAGAQQENVPWETQ